ncbi:tyrosine-protein phosphatase [Lysinibacter sp. HNR]|uniref:tyrosine-protein phosphatase n=1 Tax=Lysinibacter sp. HNR TaxID=3031408 RepID=UPI002435B9C1|nr:tyrosine-protein phosphatase [Lysinibacter sp. HNR]WGD37594.1 tyrosine-protein phosphatase [Lysinibacter sp. HNR]
MKTLDTLKFARKIPISGTRANDHQGVLYRAAAGTDSLPTLPLPFLGYIIDLRKSNEIRHKRTNCQTLRYSLNDPDFAAIPRIHRDENVFLSHYQQLKVLSEPVYLKARELLLEGFDLVIMCQLGRDRTGIVIDNLLKGFGAPLSVRVREAQETFSLLDTRPDWLEEILTRRDETYLDFQARNNLAKKAFITYILEDKI